MTFTEWQPSLNQCTLKDISQLSLSVPPSKGQISAATLYEHQPESEGPVFQQLHGACHLQRGTCWEEAPFGHVWLSFGARSECSCWNGRPSRQRAAARTGGGSASPCSGQKRTRFPGRRGEARALGGLDASPSKRARKGWLVSILHSQIGSALSMQATYEQRALGWEIQASKS